MKKLLLLLTLGLMFGHMFGGDVSQKIYEISFSDVGDYTLSDIVTEYDLEWAIVNIIACDKEECVMQMYYDIGNGNWGTDSNTMHNLRTSDINQFNSYTYYPKNNAASFYIEANQDFRIESYSGSTNAKLLVTAEFPIEDTGYIEDGFDYCVEPGANLMSYPCDSAVALLDAIPSDALSQFSGIIGQGIAATNLNGNWVGSLTAMQASSGYWIQSNTSLCFNYDCSEN